MIAILSTSDHQSQVDTTKLESMDWFHMYSLICTFTFLIRNISSASADGAGVAAAGAGF